MVAEGQGLFASRDDVISSAWFADTVPILWPYPRCPGLSMNEVIPVCERGDGAVDGDPQDKQGEAASFALPPVPRNPGNRSLRRFQRADFNGDGGNIQHVRAVSAAGSLVGSAQCV